MRGEMTGKHTMYTHIASEIHCPELESDYSRIRKTPRVVFLILGLFIVIPVAMTVVNVITDSWIK